MEFHERDKITGVNAVIESFLSIIFVMLIPFKGEVIVLLLPNLNTFGHLIIAFAIR